MAEQAAAGLRTSGRAGRGPLAGRRGREYRIGPWTWALEHDPDTALRLAVALAEWWLCRGRGEAARDVLVNLAERIAPGSQGWCLAHFWIGDLGPAAESLRYETAAYEVLVAQPPSPLLAELLAGRSRTLTFLGRIPEAISDAREALAVARQIGYPAGEVLALAATQPYRALHR